MSTVGEREGGSGGGGGWVGEMSTAKAKAEEGMSVKASPEDQRPRRGLSHSLLIWPRPKHLSLALSLARALSFAPPPRRTSTPPGFSVWQSEGGNRTDPVKVRILSKSGSCQSPDPPSIRTPFGSSIGTHAGSDFGRCYDTRSVFSFY